MDGELVFVAVVDGVDVEDGQEPSITTLMQEYGIARNTARHALAVLAEGGLIEITPGWGSFVKPDN